MFLLNKSTFCLFICSEPCGNNTRDPSAWRDPENWLEGDPENMLSCSPPYMSTSPTYMTSPNMAAMSRSWSTSSPPPVAKGHRASDPVKGHSRSKSFGFNLSEHFPDLREAIDTDFSSINCTKRRTLKSSASSHSLGSAMPSASGDHTPLSENLGYDFSRFQKYYTDHEKYMAEMQAHKSIRRRNTDKQRMESMDDGRGVEDVRDGRSWSLGDQPGTYEAEIDSALSLSDTSLAEMTETPAPPVWCLACQDNLVVAGCKSGRLEVSSSDYRHRLLFVDKSGLLFIINVFCCKYDN